MSRKKSLPKYIQTTGKRKTATVILKLFEGKGQFLVNEKPIAEYFPGTALKKIYHRPLEVGKCEGKFWGKCIARGGGKSGQAAALALALARALSIYNPHVYHSLMREAGLLTVDARVRERRKVGRMGRARKKKQSPKR